MYSNYLTLEIKLDKMKEEDLANLIKRETEHNSVTRREVGERKRKELYNICEKGYRHSGIYYKENNDTGDLFLSRYYASKEKNAIQKQTNTKLRKQLNGIPLKGSGYKKVL